MYKLPRLALGVALILAGSCSEDGLNEEVEEPTDSGTDSATDSESGSSAATDTDSGTDSGPGDGLNFPVRGVFYYPWFPETWTVEGEHVFYDVGLGYYDSSDQEVVDRHIECMDYGEVDLGIASWWGEGRHDEETRMSLLLDRTAALGSPMKWAVYYEKSGHPDKYDASLDAVKIDLNYLKDNYTSHEAYAHIKGKPVIFVYNGNTGTCDAADLWAQASNGEWYVVLKVVGGFKDCENQPDSWHQYGPSTAVHQHPGYSFVISPGFWRADESAPRLARDTARFYQGVLDMVGSQEPWQLITTFNEWGEGTAIEPAEDWSSSSGFGAYLDALHTDGV